MFAPSAFDALVTVLVGNLLLATLGIGACGLLAARLMVGWGPRAEHGVLTATLGLLLACPVALAASGWLLHGVWQLPSERADEATIANDAVAMRQRTDSSTSNQTPLASPRNPPFDAPTLHANWIVSARLAARLAAVVWGVGAMGVVCSWIRSGRVVRRLGVSCCKNDAPRTLALAVQACRAVGLPYVVPVASSPLAPGPLTLGIVRPIIVLPVGMDALLDDAELLGVLTHEAAHVARRDTTAAIAQRTAGVIFWWNPLLPAIQRGIRRTREQLCDDRVVQVQGDGLPLAAALVKVATWMLEPRPSMVGSAALLGDESELMQRMTRLIERSATVYKKPGQIAAFVLGVCVTLALGFVFVPALAAENESPAEKATAGGAKKAADKPHTLAYHDGSADGKKSLGGNGEMISFTLPKEKSKVRGVRIHGSRYGLPQAPKEDFMIYFLSQDQADTLATKSAPYSRFKRGPESWVEIKFPKPIELPKEFWVALDFRAQQTKGVYVSYDNSTDGAHSRVGLPGMESRPADVGGDWMIEVLLDE